MKHANSPAEQLRTLKARAQFAVFRGGHRKSKQSSSAFTLTELVVVIAVLGLLLLTALARPPGKAYQTACINNLRQVGNALYMFTDDNSDTLPPGPLPRGMTTMDADVRGIVYYLAQTGSPAYSGVSGTTDYKKRLAYYLAPYLGYPYPSDIPDTIKVVKALLCPGYVNTFPANSCGTQPGAYGSIYEPRTDNPPYAHAVCYSLRRSTSMLGVYPFGLIMLYPPLKMQDLALRAPPGAVWAVADLDCKSVQYPTALGQVYAYGYVAINPVHGNVRNFLFFDNHVGTKPVTGYQDY